MPFRNCTGWRTCEPKWKVDLHQSGDRLPIVDFAFVRIGFEVSRGSRDWSQRTKFANDEKIPPPAIVVAMQLDLKLAIDRMVLVIGHVPNAVLADAEFSRFRVRQNKYAHSRIRGPCILRYIHGPARQCNQMQLQPSAKVSALATYVRRCRRLLLCLLFVLIFSYGIYTTSAEGVYAFNARS